MIENLRSLGLEADHVRRLQEVCMSFGNAQVRVAESKQRALDPELQLLAAATNFRRAGAHALLLGEGRAAARCFHEAGTVYLAAGSLYGFFLQNFAPKEADSTGDQDAAEPRRASDVFWLWNPAHFDASGGLGRERVSMARRRLDGYRMETVGVLGMTVATHLEVFDAIVSASETAVAKAVFPMVAAYNTAVQRAREDRYHWKRLATPFHPVEPDVMGVLLAVSRALGARGRSLARILAGLPVNEDARRLLRGCLGQFDAWSDGE